MSRIKKQTPQYYFSAKERLSRGSMCLKKGTAPLSTLQCQVYLALSAQKKRIALKGYESVVVLLKGKARITVGNVVYDIGPRKSVFDDEQAWACFIPRGSSYFLSSVGKQAEVAIMANSVGITYADKEINPYVIVPQCVSKKRTGKGAYGRRVYTIFDGPASGVGTTFKLGETYNLPGKWSSFPPHKHAINRKGKETRHEEVYFFKVAPQDREGVLRLYNEKGLDETHVIRNNDSCVVSEGYHPVVAFPGTMVYYLWGLSGKASKVYSAIDKRYEFVE